MIMGSAIGTMWDRFLLKFGTEGGAEETQELLRIAPAGAAAAVRQAVLPARQRGERGGQFRHERAQWSAGERSGSGRNNDPPSHRTYVGPRDPYTPGWTNRAEEAAQQADARAKAPPQL